MKKAGLIFVFAILCSLAAAQKTAREYILEDVHRAANEMHRYEVLDLSDTPAPDGFVPFYISHIGRHGSRYQGGPGVYDTPIDELTRYSSGKQLTSEGEKLLRELIEIRKASEGNYGKLTDIGRQEQRDISQRMFERFTPVFRNRSRSRVTACSTSSGRVIESMDIFLDRLASNAPDLSIDKYSSKDILDGVSASDRVVGRRLSKDGEAVNSALKKTEVEIAPNPYAVTFDAALSRIFRMDRIENKKAARKTLERAYLAAQTRQCLAEERLPDPVWCLSPDEIYTKWYNSNVHVFKKFCICEENKGLYACARGCMILKHWIDDADKAIAGNDIAANLRFSHDTSCQPFFSVVGATGNDYMGSCADACSYYSAFSSVSMACNMQFIFYKNSENRILVKILHNEREVVIPSLDKESGVYHDWNVLRPYLVLRSEMDDK